MSAPMLHHRSPEFRELFEAHAGALQRVYQTEQRVLVIAGRARPAMESAVLNLASPGDRVVVASAGNFGERWAEMCDAPRRRDRAPGARVGRAARSGGHRRGGRRVRRRLHHPLRDLDRRRARRPGDRRGGAADGRRGGRRCGLEPWRGRSAPRRVGDRRGRLGIAEGADDPPGLAFVSVSERAWELARRVPTASFYLDWETAAATPRPRATPRSRRRCRCVFGLKAALELIERRASSRPLPTTAGWRGARGPASRRWDSQLFSPDDDRAPW